MQALHPPECDQHLPVGVERTAELLPEALGDGDSQLAQAVGRRVRRPLRRGGGRLDDMGRHVDRRMAPDGDQARIPLAELSGGHPPEVGHISRRRSAR